MRDTLEDAVMYEWYFPGANEMGQPTHWMPLPEPPSA